jgi:hypothetical protein
MTEADIQCLKNNIDKLVEIRTIHDECLTAKIMIVTDDDEYHVHDVMYEVITSNQTDSYVNLDSSGGYVLDFVEIVSVKPALQSRVASATPE